MSTIFTMKQARSGSLTFVLSVVIVVETVPIHLLLVGRVPILAWFLTAISVTSLVWLWRDYQVLGISSVIVHAENIEFFIGLRLMSSVPRNHIARVALLSWRDAKPHRETRYINATVPVAPNVRITLTEPIEMQLLGLVRRPVGCLGLRIDEPRDFATMLG